MTRNLLFSCYPRNPGGSPWRRSVNHFLAGKRFDQFDGRKIIIISVDECCDDPAEVQEAFTGCDCEFIVRDNVSDLQETAHFIEGLEMLENEPGITLRAHSKSCTHVDPESASRYWLDALAVVNLDFPQLISCALERSHITGAFRCQMPFGSSQFHYQGSFYWIKNSELFKRNWRNVDQWFAGVESYPGTMFQHSESTCLFFDGSSTAALYERDFHITNVRPALKWWRRNLAKAGLTPLCDDPPIIQSLSEGVAQCLAQPV